MWVILNDAYAVYILFNHHKNKDKGREEGRRKKEEGRRKKEEGRSELKRNVNYYLLFNI